MRRTVPPATGASSATGRPRLSVTARVPATIASASLASNARTASRIVRPCSTDSAVPFTNTRSVAGSVIGARERGAARRRAE